MPARGAPLTDRGLFSRIPQKGKTYNVSELFEKKNIHLLLRMGMKEF
jgi:hypothetical protein